MSVAGYTFKANRRRGRHGWLRLTPAYSVQLVEELLDSVRGEDRVLDPFCGTGTTALACATRGLACDTVDINPFLIWLTGAKTASYTEADREAATELAVSLDRSTGRVDWHPPIHAIEKWWDEPTLGALAVIHSAIETAEVSDAARTLVKIAFCRTLIGRSRASFRHQSMSFQHDISHQIKNNLDSQTATFSAFADDVGDITTSEAETPPLSSPRVLLGDARQLPETVAKEGRAAEYQVVITSPPYPNRMSYIRELRPYMYWLGFLDSAAEAGTLDWQAIGGTWGRATSNLNKWELQGELPLPAGPLTEAIDRIERRHRLLGRYVQKYVVDTATHLMSLRPLLAPGANVTYVVGNSRFFDTVLDTELIYAELFSQIGLHDIEIRRLRKRTSKRELYEYAVSAQA